MFTDIETSRLILRSLREHDRPTMTKLHTDPRTSQFVSDPPDAAEVGLLVDAWLAHWTEHGYGYCAVTTRASPDVIGLAGVRVRDFHDDKVLNLGYRFCPEVWGRGYAVEAAKAVVDWRARALPWMPLVASVNVANERSGRVAERIGLHRIHRGVLRRCALAPLPARSDHAREGGRFDGAWKLTICSDAAGVAPDCSAGLENRDVRWGSRSLSCLSGKSPSDRELRTNRIPTHCQSDGSSDAQRGTCAISCIGAMIIEFALALGLIARRSVRPYLLIAGL